MTLASIAGQPLDEVVVTLDDLIQEGLINRRGDRYRFHHDRIQEAAYSLLTPAERERIHFEIGTLELGRTPPDQLFNRIFYIVDQMNQGQALISSPTERHRLAELNLKAGIKAKESTAYVAAAGYLSAGREQLAPDSWQTDYRLTYDLHKELMECQYLNRNFEEAERLSEVIVAMSRTRVDKARVYTTMVVVYTNLRSPREAIELGLSALKLFDINISIDVGRGPVVVDLLKAQRALRRHTLEEILDLPRMQDEELLAAHELMFSIATPAYFVNPNLFALLTLRGVNDSLRHGHVPHVGPGLHGAGYHRRNGPGGLRPRLSPGRDGPQAQRQAGQPRRGRAGPAHLRLLHPALEETHPVRPARLLEGLRAVHERGRSACTPGMPLRPPAKPSSGYAGGWTTSWRRRSATRSSWTCCRTP